MGIIRGAVGERTNTQEKCLSLQLSPRQQLVTLQHLRYESAGHQTVGYSRHYLHFLSKSACCLPVLQLYTRLCLSRRVTSRPHGLAPGVRQAGRAARRPSPWQLACACLAARCLRGCERHPLPPLASCELGSTGKE